MLGALDHLAFSGVDLARQLLNLSQGSPALPVILTNCLGWATLPGNAPVRYHDGVTQTPQVAIDIRLTQDADKNLLLCVDYAEQALDGEQVQAMLDALQRRVMLMCRDGDVEIPPRNLSITNITAITTARRHSALTLILRNWPTDCLTIRSRAPR